MTLPDGTPFGPYEIRRRLGRGGMGEVYLAYDTRLKREVALKLLPATLTADPVARRRLLEEARLAARVEHPNVCGVHEVGEHEGRVFIAMPRVPGVTLEERLAAGSLPEEQAIPIALQIAQAVAHAHEQGVIHRDLKPRNVMISPEGRALVLDFGVARLSDPADRPEGTVATRTAPGVVSGTPSAMSPEQARGEPIDVRTDVFSFGALLYRMLTGIDPFEGESSADSIAAVLLREPLPLATAAPRVGGELARIVHKCLEKDRALRYGSMREVVVDLERLRRGTTAGIHVPAGTRRRGPGRAVWIVSALALAAVIAAVTSLSPWRGRGAVRTLAVLPFHPLSAGTEENYLGLGIADAIISRVSQDTGLVVRPTSAVRRYATVEASAAQAARELGVDAILEGTWQREGGRLRVTGNLLRRSDGASLWSDRFEANSGDIFAIQDTISDQLAERLRTRLANRAAPLPAHGGTKNPNAYDAYAKGLYYFSERGYSPDQRGNSDQAIRLFQEAVRLDPQYALAHAQLAYAFVWTALFIDTDSTLIAHAERELDAAERIDPGLGLVPLVRSQMLFSRYMGWRIDEAIAAIRRARTLDPRLGANERADLAMHLGVEEEWRRAAEGALAQDPMNQRVRTNYVNDAYLLDRPELGRKLQKDLLGEAPDVRYWFATGDVAHAVRYIEQFARAHPEDAFAMIDLGAARAMQGRCREADSLARAFAPRLVRDRAYHHLTYELAQLYGRCGNPRAAVGWLEQTVRWGFPCYPVFERDEWLDPVRTSPEFVAFMDRLRPVWQRYRTELLEP